MHEGKGLTAAPAEELAELLTRYPAIHITQQSSKAGD
jgi:hypothetical protein